jgi:hypothetical protein
MLPPLAPAANNAVNGITPTFDQQKGLLGCLGDLGRGGVDLFRQPLRLNTLRGQPFDKSIHSIIGPDQEKQ